MRSALLFFAGLLGLPVLFAVCAPSCLAAASLAQQIDPPQVNVGDEVTVTITLKDGDGEIHLPQVDGLPMMGNRSTSEFMWTNGVMSSVKTVSFSLIPAHPGDFVIPAFEVNLHDGGTLHTQPMKLHVLSNPSPAPAQAQTPANPAPTVSPGPGFNPNGPVVMPPTPNDVNSLAPPNSTDASTFTLPRDSNGQPAAVFMVITPQTTDAYVGQSIPLTIETYIRLDVNYPQDSLPTINGSDFLMNNLGQPQEEETNFGDAAYLVNRWRTAISAPKSGDIALQMSRDMYWVKSMTNSNLDPSGFFYVRRPNLAHEPVASNPLTIHVHSLPDEGRPANFTGAIGQLTASGNADPLTVGVGEPVTLHFTVSGTGNFGYVHSPSLTSDPAWKSYIPKSKTDFQDESRTLGTKTFDQSIIPQKNGLLPLPAASFSYFDPTAKSYVTIPVVLPSITVTGSAAPPNAPAVADSGGPAVATPTAAGFLPNRLALGTLQSSLIPAYRQSWFWTVQGGLLAAILLATIFRLLHPQRMPDPNLAERRRREDSRRLEENAMSAAVRNGDSPGFFLAARHAIQLQLGGEWQARPEALTLGEIRRRDPVLAEALEPLFVQADEVIYSGGKGAPVDLALWQERVRSLLQAQLQPA